MTLAELAGRLLKGSGHSQLQPDAGIYSDTRPSFERVNGSSFVALPEAGSGRYMGGGGFNSNTFGESKAPP